VVAQQPGEGLPVITSFTMRWLCLGWVLLFAHIAVAQAPPGTRLKGETEYQRTRKRLSEAQQKLIDGTTAEAVDELQKLLDEAGDELVLVKGGSYCVTRRLVHTTLATLPATALANYRDRVREAANGYLDLSKKTRKPEPLRELLDRYFCSEAGEEAIVLLAAYSTERGDTNEAERYWAMLLPGQPAGALSYPSPKTAPATVLANILHLRLLNRQTEQFQNGLATFKKDNPNASGLLAGITGNYTATLEKLKAAPMPMLPDAGWTTFAGSPSRDGTRSTPLPKYWPSRPTWVSAIPRDPTDVDKMKPLSVPARNALAFHPVVIGKTAYLADAGRIFQFDLATGAAGLAFHFNTLQNAPNIDKKDLALPLLQEVDMTLTADRDHLIARLGPIGLPTGASEKENVGKFRSVIAVLEKKDTRNLAKDDLTLSRVTSVDPPYPANVIASWEGCPVADGGFWYAACLRVVANKLVHSVACYALQQEKPLWVVDVCESDAARPTGFKSHLEVLSLNGSQVVFASHTGVTVALNRWNGKPAWAYRNAPAKKPPSSSPRDLCPPVCAEGMVFLAPMDGDAVIALDGKTGEPIWSVEGLQVEHLLGVVKGRLIATLHGPNKGVRGFDILTGSTTSPNGWEQHDNPQLGSYGRGALAENLLLWPTTENLYLLNPLTGRVARPPVPGPHGNLAVVNNMVLVATPTQLWGYDFSGQAVIPYDQSYTTIRPTGNKPDLSNINTEQKPQQRQANVKLDGDTSHKFSKPTVPINGGGEFLISATHNQVIAYNRAGQKLWQAERKGTEVPGEVRILNNGTLLVLGLDEVLCLKATGAKLWSITNESHGLPLSSFIATDGRLVARAGEHGLLASDLADGQLVWALDTQQQPAINPFSMTSMNRFGAKLGVDGPMIVAQVNGERWDIDLATGRVKNQTPTTAVDWATAPFVFHRNGLLVPTADGSISASINGRRTVGYEPKYASNRRSQTMEARLIERETLLLIPRNIGTEVQRLPEVRQFRPWTNPPTILGREVTLDHMAWDTLRYYLPGSNSVTAINQETGREDWVRELPELAPGNRWCAVRTLQGVLVHPRWAIPVVPLMDCWPRVVRSLWRSPTTATLIGCACTLADALMNHTFPLLMLDEATGRIDGRRTLEVLGSAVQVMAGETVTIHHAAGVVELK
jgi:outer membrane protein assembly factor BamB